MHTLIFLLLPLFSAKPAAPKIEVISLVKYCDTTSQWFLKSKGMVKIDGREAKCSINAGAFLNITYKDTTLFLGYKSKDFKKYFISGRAEN